MLVKNTILQIGITDDTQDNILEYVVKLAGKSSKKCFIVTPNPEMIMLAQKDSKFRKILNSADLALCDGAGLYIGAQVLGKGVKERITGVDFMKNLCEKVAKKPISIGFLGGRQNVAERASECLREIYPGLRINFVKEEFDIKTFPKEGVDILFVAFGAPKQEKWIYENLPKLKVKVAMGVGGSFDYISGEVSRAPFFLRAIGLEWLYRLIRQPWRANRQLALMEFIGLVVKEKFKKK